MLCIPDNTIHSITIFTETQTTDICEHVAITHLSLSALRAQVSSELTTFLLLLKIKVIQINVFIIK